MLTSDRQRLKIPAHPAMNSSSTGICFWYSAQHRKFHCTVTPAQRSSPCVMVSNNCGLSTAPSPPPRGVAPVWWSAITVGYPLHRHPRPEE